MTLAVAMPDGRTSQSGRWGWTLGIAAFLLVLVTPIVAQDAEQALTPRSRELFQNPELIEELVPLGEIAADLPNEEFSADQQLEEPIVDVVIEGRKTIAEHAVLHYVQAKSGRIITPREIQEDVTALRRTQWFSSVRPVYRRIDTGLVLVYMVREKPIIRSVQFIGHKKIKKSELEAHTGLRMNQPFDVNLNKEAVARIQSLYREKGYRYAEVVLSQGGHPDDREVVINITEGPKTRVNWTAFEGNTFEPDGVLRSKLASKLPILWLFGGVYNPETVENDVLTITKYYNNLGFFDATVEYRAEETPDHKWVNVTFVVNEGQRYTIRNIDLIGNEVLEEETLFDDPKLRPGDPFNYRHLQHDLNTMKDQYDELGRLFAEVKPTPIFLDTPGVIDLEYRINEDRPFLVGDIRVNFRGDNPHTREDVVLNPVVRLVKPGQLANGRKINLARARVMRSQLWDPAEPATFEIVPVDGRDYTLAAEDDPLGEILRGQSFDESFFGEKRPYQPTAGYGHSLREQRVARTTARPSPLRDSEGSAIAIRSQDQPHTTTQGATPVHPMAAPPVVNAPAVNRTPRSPLNSTKAGPSASLPSKARAKYVPPALYHVDPEGLFNYVEDPDLIVRGQSELIGPSAEDVAFARGQSDSVPRGQSIDGYGRPVPGDLSSGANGSGDPLGGTTFGRTAPPPGYVDFDIDVTEGRTGRFMIGAGVNSNNGVVGSAVLQEDNFDILRPPRSWSDIVNGYAWRGAGQSFRLEAQPGDQVSRYMLSWSDPYFMRSDFNVGVSGFYFNRFYNEWVEDRLGGRFSIGKILNEYWSANISLRLEDVKIRSIPAVAPQDLQDVKGNNFLSTVAFTLSNDTRDNSFLPSEGHFLEGTFEQAFGEFNYPRVELSASQYFTLYERADGFGKHILQVHGAWSWSGDDTPIFERYYGGGYSLFRGFAFRGVTPRENGVRVGGNWMALGTVEYMMPITANDQIRTVVFTDFGTVEKNIGFDDFRVSAGFGFRLVIPAMGPAPIAFDFAWPLVDQEEDNRRVFSFYVGFTR